MSPQECESIGDVMSLDKSCETSGRFGLLIQHDGSVILTDHAPGLPCKAQIEIPRRHFRRLVEFYMMDQARE